MFGSGGDADLWMFTLGAVFGIAFSILCVKLELKYGNVKVVRKDKDDKG